MSSELQNSHHQKSTLDYIIENRKQGAVEEAEEPGH